MISTQRAPTEERSAPGDPRDPAEHRRREREAARGQLLRDRAWPTGSGRWLARASGDRLGPRSSWGLFRPAGTWPKALRRLDDRGRLRWLADSAVAAWQLESDPVLESVVDVLDPRTAGLARFTAGRGEIVAYKPLRRTVVRFDDRNGARRFVKYLRPGCGRAVEERHALLAAWTRTSAGFALPDLVDCGRRPDCQIWRGVEGVPLERALLEMSGRAAIAVAGRCIASLHRCPARPSLLRSRVVEMGTTRDWLSVARSLRLLGRRSRSTLADLAASAARIPAARPVLSHGDLHDGQFLLVDETTYLLDLDTLTLAEPELDLGNLLAHLDLLRFRRPALEGPGLDETLLEAYVRGRGRLPDRRRLAWYRALSALRLACVHAPRPETARLAPRLASWAGQLAGRLWEEPAS